MIRLAPEGWPFVLPGLVLTVLALGSAVLLPDNLSTLGSVLWWTAGLLGVLTGFTAFFFRDPVRRRENGEGLVLAPGDGRIVHIVDENGGDPFLPSATRISIFLSVFNVHVQRAPVTGTIALRQYRAGSFAMAWKGKASEENEQATLGIDTGSHRLMVRQIAGWVARRIVTDPEEGDRVPQGARIGLIRFGSRVDLLMPRDWEVLCRVGDRVKGGITAMARVSESREGSGS
jgi:phosphatidylserine decarboxylase